VFGRHRDAPLVAATSVHERWRQCTHCTEAWEENPARELSACPRCGALTMLTSPIVR
jgi:hypothetical protein